MIDDLDALFTRAGYGYNPMRFRKQTATITRLSACALASQICIRPAVASPQPIILDKIFSVFAKDCNFDPDFQNLFDDVVKRYSFDGPRRPSPVRIPEAVRPAFGKATAMNRGAWTLINIPVRGIFHGLPTTGFQFDAGHGNGISVVTLMFSLPRSDLEKTFGRSFRETDKRLTAEAQKGEPSGLTPKIADAGTGSEIICDWSD